MTTQSKPRRPARLDSFIGRQRRNGASAESDSIALAALTLASQGRKGYNLSIVIPTRNEEQNVKPLVERLTRALAGERIEIIFVDDSDDGTPETIRETQATSEQDITLIHRLGSDRVGGLSGSVVEGMRRASGQLVCVMDSDLQHPPEAVPHLLARARVGDVALVVGTRGGDHEQHLGFFRRQISRGLTWSARAMFPLRLRRVSDPMSGFFMVRSLQAEEFEALHPRGFKILFELVTRFPHLEIAEVPYSFRHRLNGKSNAAPGHAIDFFRSALEIRTNGTAERMAKFSIVGLSGIAVNLALTAFFTETVGVYYLASAILATQGSTAWNFAFLERWVFLDRPQPPGRRLIVRFLVYAVTNNSANALRIPLLLLLTGAFGVHYLIGTVVTLIALFLVRYALSSQFIWPHEPPERHLTNA